MNKIRLHLRIPDLLPDDQGSAVRIAVRDTTQADALHPTVAEASGTVPVDADDVKVDVNLPDQPLDPRRRYSVWAHVDHSGNGQLGAGDLITTQDVQVGPEDVGASPVEVPLTRI
jgi:hypothetical protein